LSKFEKLKERFQSKPKDFSWEELAVLLIKLGYKQLEGNGSRVKFIDKENNIINLHKPHPKNIVKEYLIKQVSDHLKERGKL